MLTPAQAYSLNLMGIVHWELPNQTEQMIWYRPHQPWPDPTSATTKTTPAGQTRNQEPAFVENAAHNSGFETTPTSNLELKRDSNVSPLAQADSVNHLRAELDAMPDVIVEDLQPIEEMAVAIQVSEPIAEEHLPKQLHCCAFLAQERLLILSDIPPAFADKSELENLAIKMSQALLKQPVNDWRMSEFDWPGQLKNPDFQGRSDWMLGAFESFVLAQVPEVLLGEEKQKKQPFWVVLAGKKVQKLRQVFDSISASQPMKIVDIVSLPELYRIPEYKAEAWQQLQHLLKAI
ncbi:hypothetical protein CBF23_014300 [Marinomonas agarivorans]|nr:hypothetical protein CBF23_014300 [Marinomonas agarivorans]